MPGSNDVDVTRPASAVLVIASREKPNCTPRRFSPHTRADAPTVFVKLLPAPPGTPNRPPMPTMWLAGVVRSRPRGTTCSPTEVRAIGWMVAVGGMAAGAAAPAVAAAFGIAAFDGRGPTRPNGTVQ